MESNRINPLIFISHDARDVMIAKAFASLIQAVTAGYIQTFWSSDKSGKEGIGYGKEWYQEVNEKMTDCSEVVCLLSPRSCQRQWLLYEAGMGKGKGRIVHGLLLGIEASDVCGPFTNFQLCDLRQDSLTGLIMQLVQRHSTLNPDPRIVTAQIKRFIKEAKRVIALGNAQYGMNYSA